MNHRHTLSAVCCAVFAALSVQGAESSVEDDQKDAEVIVTIGTRVSGRTATESAAPVDIISSESIRNAGISDTGELLRALAPSFNMNNTTTSDGQDLMRPATLRSMGPDQVLVLVNGKRRHQQAIVAVQQNVGRGNAGTDFNAIPITAIDRVEVLRDGAAAQYGSDAIAGVINIILKDDEGTRGFVHYGRTKAGDGVNKQVGVNTGFVIADDGVFNVSIEWQNKGMINRAADSTWYDTTSPARQLLLVGEAPVVARQLWWNSELPIANGALYFFGGVGQREAESLGFYRHIYNNRQLAAIYPDGITPKLGTQSDDRSLAFGYRTDLGNSAWDMDVSFVSGDNHFEFRNLQSLNVSYGPTSPTSAYDGALNFKQKTVNIDFSGTVPWGVGDGDLSLAFGLERRSDGYELEAGDEVSYARGSEVGWPGAIDCHPLASSCVPGSAGYLGTPPGMQGFQGYRPEHEIDTDRDNTALYVDSEAYLTESFSIGAALRFEDYSDFGKTTTGKLSMRQAFNAENALRLTLSTGFRAPGIQQQYFTQRSISLGANGELQDLVTLRPGSTLARELGFYDLTEETSRSISLGFVHEADVWTSTIDVYQIDIDDRIVYSQGISASAGNDVADFFARHAAISDGGDGQLDGVAAVEIFTNAANTRTRGLDWVNTWHVDAMTYEASLHMNDNQITKRHTTSSIVDISRIIDPGIENLLESAQPARKATLAATWHPDSFALTARANYYGEYSDHTAAYGLPKHTFDARTIFDLTMFRDVDENLRLAGGILNVFDTYPSKWGNDAIASDGTDFRVLGFVYGWNSVPFGLAGRQYYLRAEFTF